MLASPCSGYYSINDLNKLTKKAGPSLFIFHCNTRSLSNNFDTLEEILNSLDSKPDILGITETKLGELSITTDQWPELIMAFQDLHLWPLEFGKKYLTV